MGENKNQAKKLDRTKRVYKKITVEVEFPFDCKLFLICENWHQMFDVMSPKYESGL